MDIRILKDKNNALLNRRELDFIVKYEGSTPSRNDVRNKLAAMLNAPLELMVVQRIKTEYGMQEGKGYAKLYENADRMVFILFLVFILLLPGFRQGRPSEEELEPLMPPYPDLDIPESILEEFGEKLEKSLFSPEPMEESVSKLGDFWSSGKK